MIICPFRAETAFHFFFFHSQNNPTMLPTSARWAPSRAGARGGPRSPLACASATTRTFHLRKSLPRNDRSPPKVANAARRSMPTRTLLRAHVSLGDGGDEKQVEVQQPQPPLLLPPPPPRLALPLAWRALEAALWPELVITWISAKKREVTA